MKITMAQINPTVGDLEGNTKKILHSIDLAKQKGADLVVCPELCLCGYPPADLLLLEGFVAAQEPFVEKIVEATQGICVVFGLCLVNEGGGKPLFNGALIAENGKRVGTYRKQLLPNYNVFDERRYFEPGAKACVFPCKGKQVGVVICEDIWQHSGFVEKNYTSDPITDLASEPLDLLVNLSASPYSFEKPDTRYSVLSQAAKSLGCPVALCCQVGGNDDLVFDGYSMFVGKGGGLLKIGAGFSEDHVLCDLEAKEEKKLPQDPLSDLYHALVLGVRDYFKKQGFSKALIGLSGGIDSALVACIAKEALGKENVLAIAMPSRFSSEQSLEDARDLANRLDISLKEISIESPFSTFLELLEPEFGSKEFDITEENMQARIRGLILMAFSNKWGHLVLSTGNKSEMGLGYCTLYGDMCGGLGVIADVLKTRVYALCEWINKDQEIIPVSILQKPPSAELKEDQKDTDSLPEYSVVDQVLVAYVEEHKSAEKIAKECGLSLQVVEELIDKLLKAEYKRRQAPPAIRVSPVAFSVGRRFPIVQKWR